MPNIEFAPPHHRGVTEIMGVGDVDIEPTPIEKRLSQVQWVSLGALVIGALTGSQTVKRVAMGAVVATFAASYLGRKDAEARQAASERAAQATAVPQGMLF